MENEKIEKSLWATVKGTLQGINNEGSAKRMMLFFFSFILLFSMTMVYLFCFYAAATSLSPTSVQTTIVGMYKDVNYSYQLSCWMFAGLATIETITSLVKTFRGSAKIEESK